MVILFLITLTSLFALTANVAFKVENSTDTIFTVDETGNVNITGNVRIPDNIKTYYGDDDDVCMYWDGSSFIISSSC